MGCGCSRRIPAPRTPVEELEEELLNGKGGGKGKGSGYGPAPRARGYTRVEPYAYHPPGVSWAPPSFPDQRGFLGMREGQ